MIGREGSFDSLTSNCLLMSSSYHQESRGASPEVEGVRAGEKGRYLNESQMNIDI